MSRSSEHEESIDIAVARITNARSAIDQTKGMIMLIYGVSEDEAFERLRSQARRTRLNLHTLATQFRDDVASLDHTRSIPPRAVFERLLRTAHTRLPPQAGRARDDEAQ